MCALPTCGSASRPAPNVQDRRVQDLSGDIALKPGMRIEFFVADDGQRSPQSLCTLLGIVFCALIAYSCGYGPTGGIHGGGAKTRLDRFRPVQPHIEQIVNVFRTLLSYSASQRSRDHHKTRTDIGTHLTRFQAESLDL